MAGRNRRGSWRSWGGASLLALVLAMACTEVRGEEPPAPLHARWDRLLHEYVSEEGWVDYDRLRDEAGGELRAYLNDLAAADLEPLGRDARKAFWINAYNALVVQNLLERGIPDSVPRRSVLGIGTNIFKLRSYRIAGKVRSLDEIEHKILRPTFRDPRVHAALVCGASSCPRLRPEAYRAERLDAQLDEEMRRFINTGTDLAGRRKNYLDRGKKVFYASKIFDWFGEDFGGSDRAILAFIARWAEPPVRTFLQQNEVRLKYLEYDWSVNRRASKPRAGGGSPAPTRTP